jgi:hypothetical protein
VLHLPPSGSKGLMLGEILGLNAGLTRVEEVLLLFFAPLPPRGSSLLAFAGLDTVVGEAIGPTAGLCMPESATAAEGELSGPSLGVFLAETLGVETSSEIVDSVRDIEGCEVSAASGSVSSSSIGVAPDGWLCRPVPCRFGDMLLTLKLGDCSRISDAGVAGIPWMN